MRIGVDATCWANRRGYGRFARELMRALLEAAPGHQWTCFGDRRAFDAWAPSGPNVVLREVEVRESPTLGASSGGNRSPADMLRLTRAVWRERPRVFFSPSVYTYFPLPPRQRAVVTIHDAIAERFPLLTLPSFRARVFWRAKVSLAVRQADLILTVSRYAARDLERVLHIDARRIRVAVEAPSATFRPCSETEVDAAAKAAGVPAGVPWFTYVGGFNPHKRIDLIVEALARLASRGPGAPHLVLVGATTGDVFHGDAGRLRSLVAERGLEGLVHWTGFLPDESLRALHSGAAAALLPSECEGFGLPAVEAAACGTPVIATVESPLPELLEGGGVFVRPGDLDVLHAAMSRMLDDAEGRASMGKVARARAEALTWESCAHSALAAITEAAA